VDFTLNERDLFCQIPDNCAKFHQNPLKIATVSARTHKSVSDIGYRKRQMILYSVQCCYT